MLAHAAAPGWSLPVVALALGALAIAAYLAGVRRLGGRGRAWPLTRTVPFVAGVAVLVVAAAWPFADPATSFVGHVGQHLVLSMLAPPLLALGAPVTLALQAGPPGARSWIRRALHWAPVRVVGHPLVAAALFSGGLWVLYFTDLYRLSQEHALVHEAVHLHFLVAGLLFFWPVVGVDAGPWRLPHAARLLLVGLVIPLHAFLGLALMQADAPLPHHTLDDVDAGAALMWVAGDLLAIGVLALVVTDWIRVDARTAAREDRATLAAARP